MKIYSWNVNGLRAVIRKKALEVFLERENPDILCLQETKIGSAGLNSEKIPEKYPNYHQFYSFATRPGYSGTAIWVKTSVGEERGGKGFLGDCEANGPRTTARSPVTTGAPQRPPKAPFARVPLDDQLNEGRLTCLEFEKIYLISVYVPNAKPDLSRLSLREKEWGPFLRKTVEKLEAKKPVIITGDFNVAREPIDLARPKENVGKHGYTDEERADFTKLLGETNLVDTFRSLHPTKVKYSWWSHWGNARANNVGWRIDYFLASKSLMKKITSADIHPEITGSDHCPISLRVDL